MATLVPPKILLLDEHTAALDPQAAEKIMALTKQITDANHTTCLMVTHNLKQAVSIGNRTLMMANGHIVVDLKGEQRKGLAIQDLMNLFKEQAGKELDNDRILLSEGDGEDKRSQNECHADAGYRRHCLPGSYV